MQNTTTTPAAPKPAPGPSRQTPPPPPEFRTGRIDAMEEPELIALLKKKGATEFEKAKSCQRLALAGTEAAVPALAPLVADPKLSQYARNALEVIPGTASAAALRAALGKTDGVLLVGVLNSIGVRRDGQAVPAAAKLLTASDPQVAAAAAAALGRISGPEAALVLEGALPRSSGPQLAAVADACLICAERLLESGGRERAMALYNKLAADDMPKPARLAAMHGIIAAETSLKRPR